MKKRRNTSQGATALRSAISVILMLVSAVLLSLAASPEGNRVGHNGSESTDNVKTSPGWSPTGSLGAARFNHTATLLPNGKVLVAGGKNGDGASGYLSSAELYDPATGSWSVTGSLHTAREFHTATLLPNGKVLVAGGENSSSGTRLSSAELYDPATGSWSVTGDLNTARNRHTATLLPNGKVLVVGGGFNSNFLSSAELYDPASGIWSPTGSLAIGRTLHTATLLPNGKVLVVGGAGNGSGDDFFLRSAELYDPASGMWSVTGSLLTGRYSHTATLLPNGKVLVAGGFSNGSYPRNTELYDPGSGMWSSTGSLSTGRELHTAILLPNGNVLVAGGNSNTSAASSAELYDPASGIWSPAASLSTGRALHTATLLSSGKLLVEGGVNDLGSSVGLSSAELYEPANGSWNTTGSPSAARYDHTATLLPNGKVLVAAGVAGGDGTGTELYDPAIGSWSSTGSLAAARFNHTATLLPSGKVLVAGGRYPTPPFNSAELYDPATGNWSSTGSLLAARSEHTATLLPSGKVLVAAGVTAVPGSAELYDPATATWSSTGGLVTARFEHTATLLASGKVLVAGGRDTSGLPTSSAELYDPATGNWSSTGSLVVARQQHTATLLASGKVLVTAGVGNGFNSLNSAELYDPATGSWSSTGSLSTARDEHTATLLASGKVLVTGGEIIGGGGAAFSSAELYDPATGMWSSTASLGSARRLHAATLLPSGKVLVAGGINGNDPLSSAELYDPGLGFDPAWQPLLNNVSPSTVPSGSALVASGSRFKGISEASGGNGTHNSSSNYPLVQLLSLTNEQTLFLPVDAMAGWSDTSFTSQPLTIMTESSSGFPVGYALVTVFTNGIPSQSQFVLTAPAPSGECTVCHKRTQTLVLPCNSMDYRRHLDHGDTIGACPSDAGRKD